MESEKTLMGEKEEWARENTPMIVRGAKNVGGKRVGITVLR